MNIMKLTKKTNMLLWAATLCATMMMSCSDDTKDDPNTEENSTEASYIGKAVGNFSAEEWYVGGELGTTMNVTAGCYEDETPAVTQMGLTEAFDRGTQFFERNVTEFQAPFNGLGPAYVRKSCLDCHPGYGHGKRVDQYRAEWGNGYLLVVYHPNDGLNSDDGPYVSEVTGMPQTRAVSPFLPPVDESGIHLQWLTLTAMGEGSEISATQFPDGERYQLIYPELSIDREAFNTNPTPWETGNGAVAFRLESTIGIIGSGLLDAIPDDSIETIFVDCFLAVLSKSHAAACVGRHLAEVACRPSTDGEDDLQVRILFLQLHHFTQEVSVLNGHAIKGIGHLSKGIVQVGHQRRVRHALRAP